MTRSVQGQLNASGIRFAVVASRFNSFITEKLVDGATDSILRHGGSRNDIATIWVPGSMELPLACKKAAESGQFDAVIAIGAIIRGATTHYDLVCGETAGGIMRVGLETSIPVTFGVITTDTIEQAIERSGTKAGNKGADAALAAVEMVNVIREIEKGKL